jgi:hypothetical protein
MTHTTIDADGLAGGGGGKPQAIRLQLGRDQGVAVDRLPTRTKRANRSHDRDMPFLFKGCEMAYHAACWRFMIR